MEIRDAEIMPETMGIQASKKTTREETNHILASAEDVEEDTPR